MRQLLRQRRIRFNVKRSCSNDEKYRVDVPPGTPEDEVALFVQKSAGSKWLRKECAKDRSAPWCDVAGSFQMPRQYFTWQYLAVSMGGPLSLLLVGNALYWAFSGFRRSADS
jgi:predicted metal-dependent hydrolase